MREETRPILTRLILVIIGATMMEASGPVVAGYYQMTPSTDGDATPLYYDNTLPIVEIGWGSFTANAGNWTATCTADSYTRAKPGTADFDAEGWGQVKYTWQWYGPPSTPAGGILYWENDGDGGATVDGNSSPGENGSASSYGTATTETFVSALSSSVTGGAAWGYVEDGDMAIGDAYASGNPVDPHTINTTKEPDYGGYYFDVSWNGYYDANDEIPSGTGNFYVVAEADCQCTSYSYATGSGDASTDTTSEASLLAYVRFTSN